MVNNDKSYNVYNRTKIGIFFVSPTLWGVNFSILFSNAYSWCEMLFNTRDYLWKECPSR